MGRFDFKNEKSRIPDWNVLADVGGVIGFHFPAGNPALIRFSGTW
jgi:hypothetical protein